MTQLSIFQPLTWTVSELTHYLRDLLESDEYLQELWVEGEVSNLSRPASGHLYFTLKDAGASLRCVMWRNAVLQQRFLPKDGDAVQVHGSISVYEAGGNYQLYADVIRSAGEGALYQQFLELKARLEAEGLFDAARKRPIPRWPHTIGIVTSPTGAALRDMLNTIRRRYPLVNVVLAPTPVQGEEAPAGIIAALEALNRLARPDVILLARGGGSIEDLWAFNDERVARAILSSESPVITGVGHETDFTIADFTADLRAPTPTAAAELATPNQVDLRLALAELRKRLIQATATRLSLYRSRLETASNRLRLRSPRTRIRRDRQRLDEIIHRGLVSLKHLFAMHREHLTGMELRLHALNPHAVLERGYAIVTRFDGQIVRSVLQVRPDDDLSVRVSDGSFGARVHNSGESS